MASELDHNDDVADGEVAERTRTTNSDPWDLVRRERDYQIVEFPVEHDDAVSREDWIAKITRYAGQAYGADDERYERSLVQVAAVSIAAIFAHRRVSLDGRRVLGLDALDGTHEDVPEIVDLEG